MKIATQIEMTITWLRQLAQEAHADGLVVGVSGGIDSALVSYLIKEAFPNHSLGVIMPCKSNEQDRLDALQVVQAAKLDFLEVDLTATHHLLFSAVQQGIQARGEWKEEKQLLGDANLRARLRMSTLYTVANNYNYLVVGTDNAAELYVGYFTKYGDGGVDCLPIAHLTKREVGLWAAHVGVPQAIIDKVPSAGLWEGQSDEEEMGTTYAIVDDYLEGKQIPEQDQQIIVSLHQRSEHKRNRPPQFPK